jgi:hypothetical protein
MGWVHSAKLPINKKKGVIKRLWDWQSQGML